MRDSLSLERLKSLGGETRFRHGSTDEKIQHLAARRGVMVEYGNPAYTSSVCPRCGAVLVEDAASRVVSCPSCGLVDDHDAVAPANIGVAVFKKLGCCVEDVQVDDARERSVKSEVRVRARRAKMDRRRARGVRVYHVNSRASVRRPSGSYAGERGSWVDSVPTVGDDVVSVGSVGGVFQVLCGGGDFSFFLMLGVDTVLLSILMLFGVVCR